MKRMAGSSTALVFGVLLSCTSDGDGDAGPSAAASASGGASTQASSTGSGGGGGGGGAPSSSSGGGGGTGGSRPVYCNGIDACMDRPPGDRDPTNDCYSCSMGRGEACQADGDACAADPECPALIECKNACGSIDCIVACEQDHPFGLVLLSNLEFCICYMGCPNACGQECGR